MNNFTLANGNTSVYVTRSTGFQLINKDQLNFLSSLVQDKGSNQCSELGKQLINNKLSLEWNHFGETAKLSLEIDEITEEIIASFSIESSNILYMGSIHTMIGEVEAWFQTRSGKSIWFSETITSVCNKENDHLVSFLPVFTAFSR